MGPRLDLGGNLHELIEKGEGRLHGSVAIRSNSLYIIHPVFIAELTIGRQVLVDHDGQDHDGRETQGQPDEIDKGDTLVTDEIPQPRAEIDLEHNSRLSPDSAPSACQ